jgi:hypothetical protein
VHPDKRCTLTLKSLYPKPTLTLQIMVSCGAQALTTLDVHYAEGAARGEPMPCEAEFRAYGLLIGMGVHGRYRDPADFMKNLSVRRRVLGMIR